MRGFTGIKPLEFHGFKVEEDPQEFVKWGLQGIDDYGSDAGWKRGVGILLIEGCFSS